MTRTDQQKDFNYQLIVRTDSIYSVNPDNDYPDGTIIAFDTNEALDDIASVTANPQEFDRNSVHIWETNATSFGFKLPAGTQLRDLNEDDIARINSLED
jgi:hypothetical protein